jgi:hypothetical protein
MLGLLTLPISVAAQTAPPKELAARHFEIHRAASPIKIDGLLDEPAWASALTYDLPYEWSPGDNVAPPVHTDFLVTYDDDNLYAAWRAQDPDPAAIRAHLMDRDEIDTLVQDDHVVLVVDTFNDQRRGFQFRINPLGVQADAVFSENEGIEDFSFDMIWASAGRITADGYVVEIAIPLNQLRFPRVNGAQVWGFDVGRSYPRSARHRITASPRQRGAQCVLCQADKVSGFEDLKPGRNLELTPTVTANRTDEVRTFPGDLETGDEDVDPGVTARWGITPNLTLSAAVNPDFSQVEADAAQLQVNERFALFFPEKRPFFLEGIDIFSTPIQAVFTRTVVNPDWGAKVTGKEQRNAFGVFVASDEVNTLTIPSNQGSAGFVLDEPVDSGVVRYRRDVGAASSVGVLFTGREGDDYHNRVAGLDGFFRFGANDSLRVQALRSDTLYPDQVARSFNQDLDAFQGDALLFGYDHSSRDWNWSVSYEDRDPAFRADSGYVPRVDVRNFAADALRNFYGDKDDWWTQGTAGLFVSRVEDHTGQLTDESYDLYGNLSGPLQSFFEISIERNRELVQGVLYEGMNRVQASSSVQPSGAARLAIFLDTGEAVDYQNNRPADLLLLNPSAELKLGSHLNARINHLFQRLDVDGGRLFEANLSQLRLVYNFNVRMFVRGIFQYLDLEQDPDLFTFPVDPKTETLFTQLLFSYKLNPQTVLFLGYSDDRLGLQGISLDQTSRTFFFKVGYAFVL